MFKWQFNSRQGNMLLSNNVVNPTRLFLSQHLLQTGIVSVNDTDVQSRTPLYYAVQSGSLEVIKELVKAGAKLHMTEAEIAKELCIASAGNAVARLQCCLAAGADMNSRDQLGSTCLHVAIFQKHQSQSLL